MRRLKSPDFPGSLLSGLLLAAALVWTLAPTVPLRAEDDAAITGQEPRTEDIIALTDELLQQIEKDSAGEMWDAVNRLVRLGRSNGVVVTDRVNAKLACKDQKTRLACARALCQMGHTDAAVPALIELLKSGSAPELRRFAANAIALTPTLYGNDSVGKTLSEALKSESDAMTKIALARSLWYVGPQLEGREALLTILAEARDKSVRDEAVLTLAENGGLKVADVRTRMLNLSNEPTPRGERARNCLRSLDDDASFMRESQIAKGDQLLHEIVGKIKAAYPDETRCDLERLYEDAAKGMVGGLDPFSQYLDRDDVKATQEMLSQDYGGIGAYVGTRNGLFVVISPIYGSPADRAGIRARDIIQEVDGHKASEFMEKGGVNGMISRLKGPPGTPVRIKFTRRGFAKPVELSLVRESIRVESVCSAVLPGNIGYVRLTRFGERSCDEMQKALDDLLRARHVAGLVFDLRDNPGGLLRAGVEIAEKFLGPGKLVVYSEGNKEFAPRKEYISGGPPENENFPLVVLVGAGSASASEIVAGALQDHHRAPLIGERTYGKGSVQQIIPLRTTDQKTQLRLTIARYYLPSGRCIHEKGVDVDVEVHPTDRRLSMLENAFTARQQTMMDDFVRGRWEANTDLFSRLAICDDERCENWPGFDAFFAGLHTPHGRDEVRAEVRQVARRKLEEEQKRQLACDWETDEVLQRGVLELLKKLKIDPQGIADYRALPEKFNANGATQEGAMLPGVAPVAP